MCVIAGKGLLFLFRLIRSNDDRLIKMSRKFYIQTKGENANEASAKANISAINMELLLGDSKYERFIEANVTL